MLDAHQLNIFLTAAETLNFTEAADRLHMSQPSVSQHIRTLEKHFNTKLFLRHGRSLELSDAGRTLVPMAQNFVKQSICIDETMISIHGKVHGLICLGCNTTAGRYFLPDLVAEFHGNYPEVTISCDNTCNSPLDGLQEGTLHFAVTSESEKFNKDIEFQPVLTEDICLITAQDHPWNIAGRIHPKQLLEEKFILPTKSSEPFQLLRKKLFDVNMDINDLDTFLHLGTPEALILSVQKGLGVGFASRQIASILSAVGLVQVEGLEITRENFIARSLSYPTTAAREAFWNYIKAEKIQGI